ASTVAGRSGSASAGSIPAASIAASPSSRRLVPRTAQPSTSSRPPSSRPRQPQPTISARANSPRLGAPATAQLLQLLRGDFLAQLLLVAFADPAATAHVVLRLQHLLHVVDFVLRLEFGRASRLPVEQFGVVAGVEMIDQEEDPDDQ